MTEDKTDTPHKQPRLMRILRARPRLFLSGALGLLIVIITPSEWHLATRALAGWDIGVALYLIFAYETIARGDIAHIRHRAAIEDEGRVAILTLTATAALASLGAIVAELSAEAGRQPMQLALAIVTILLSWALTHTMFAFHYAHEFYGEHSGKGGGLVFPGNEQPDYWDFVYFSFVIGMTAQVSDVTVTARPIRRTVIAHGIVSFMFNASLLALLVNIAANAI
jgi:uncharacterized membrane protein